MIFDSVKRKVRVGVDVDGVLGDQVSPLLGSINGKNMTNLSKEDIIEWDFKINDSNIEIEINKALLSGEYIQNMPEINGAKKGMNYLWENYHVIIASSRPKQTEEETLKWLSSKFNFHEYINTHKSGKKSLQVDILIDDNLTNVEEFSRKKGVGILFSQPWNQKHQTIKDLIKNQRVFCCNDWAEVISTLKILNR